MVNFIQRVLASTIVHWVSWNPITFIWYWIGTHDEYDELLKRL